VINNPLTLTIPGIVTLILFWQALLEVESTRNETVCSFLNLDLVIVRFEGSVSRGLNFQHSFLLIECRGAIS
jgi:hypothetical protein